MDWYRVKPPRVQAIQYTRFSDLETMARRLRTKVSLTIDTYNGTAVIESAEGERFEIAKYDYLVVEDGKFCVMKEYNFQSTYEPESTDFKKEI